MIATTQRQSPSASAALAAAAAGAVTSPLGMLKRHKSSGTLSLTSSRTLSASPRRASQSRSPPKLARGASANIPKVMKPPFPLPGSEFGNSLTERNTLREVTVGEEFRSCPKWDEVTMSYNDGTRIEPIPPELQFSSQRMKDTLATSEAYLQQLKADLQAGSLVPKSREATLRLRLSMAGLATTVNQLKPLTTDQGIPDNDVAAWEDRFFDYKSIFNLSRKLTAALHGLRECVNQSCYRSTKGICAESPRERRIGKIV